MEVKPYALAKAIGCTPANITILAKKDPPRVVRNSGGMIDLHNPVNKTFIIDRGFTLAEIESRCAEHVRKMEARKKAAIEKSTSERRRKGVRESRANAEAEIERIQKKADHEADLFVISTKKILTEQFGEKVMVDLIKRIQVDFMESLES
jgi:DNA-binding transcriptional MerR regulator